MGEKQGEVFVIQNIGAVAGSSNLKTVETMEKSSDQNGARKTYEIICWMYEKFKKNQLEEKDFETALKEFERDENDNIGNENEGKWDDLDKVVPVEVELDFQDGEIKVTSASCKDEKNGKCTMEKENKKESRPKAGKGLDDKINKQMKYLMTTFEQEKKNLLKKVELEKEIIAKQVADDYERKLKVEKDFLGTVIADLVKTVEDTKSQVEELQSMREHDRVTLHKFFKRKLADEKKKIILEVTSKQGHD